MSKLNRIKSLLQKALYEFGQISTDKGILSYDGDELEVGMEVFIVDEEGNESKPEDGTYATEDKEIVVADGKVSEINDKEQDEPGNEAENEPEEEVEAHEEGTEAEEAPETVEVSTFRAVGLAFEATYDEKLTAIAQAVRELGLDAYVVEAADTYCVVCAWNEEGGYYDKYYRFSISWDGDKPVLSDMEEVREEFVPADEPSPFEEVENLRAEVATLKAQLGEPKGTPAVEEFRQATAPTGNKTMDKIVNLFSK